MEAHAAPLRIAILWHMHQPNYQEPGAKRLLLPWVRLHALKDYLDMPIRAAAHPGVVVTFNLVPSLLDQLQLYEDGAVDRHLELTAIDAEQMSAPEKREALETLFQVNPSRMIEPYPRFLELYRKFQQITPDNPQMVSLFSSSEIRDLQTWGTLCWVDELFRTEEPIRTLLAKGRHFTEEDKRDLLAWQKQLLARIIPAYQHLYAEGRIDLSFTPYYHPILPLLCDTETAREALPDIVLPKQFRHPEDAERQIAMAQDRFSELFGRPLVGMWPSEGSVSEETARRIASAGISWAATDEEILFQSLQKSGLPRYDYSVYQPYRHQGVTLFFRDHVLSDRIGFVYSGWPAERAVTDFIGHLKSIRSRFSERLDSLVVPIILDGENCWEYYAHDGHQFLTLLYERIASDPELQAISLSDAAAIRPVELPRLSAGSWINHNFRIWIGHQEDNAAWNLLQQTRDDLVAHLASHPEIEPEKRAAAWKQIYIAEGSDWCWWYGDDHVGPQNNVFDDIFRRHLIAVYQLVGLPVPDALYLPISGAWPHQETARPEGLITPVIDGRMTQYYEWSGAASFDALTGGGSMHRVDRQLGTVYFAFDRTCLYLRVDMGHTIASKDTLDRRLVVRLTNGSDERFAIPLKSTGGSEEQVGHVRYAVDKIVELALPRQSLTPDGSGILALQLAIEQAGEEIERWPENSNLMIELPKASEELFWPV